MILGIEKEQQKFFSFIMYIIRAKNILKLKCLIVYQRNKKESIKEWIHKFSFKRIHFFSEIL